MNIAQTIDKTKILTRSEISTVIADLERKGKRSVSTRMNRIVFRLATCCGLRVSEVVGITLSNVKTEGQRPHVYIPKQVGKGKRKARQVPLNWDAATLADLRAWKQHRHEQGALGSERFIASQSSDTAGKPLERRNAQNRWDAAIKSLCTCERPAGKHNDDCRVSDLSIHCGRHSFCSHALAGGRTLVEVRDAAGHANISTTSLYLHIVRDDDETVGDLFGFQEVGGAALSRNKQGKN
ncbi:tyrosine-type recombinase/integrase [Rosistilla oblonga]|uniref:tyrosine-type recombinase/integrase n=1 Tax=Rosistilla oblonga TaxID=2527990 RepID=UPI003A97EB01